MCDTYHIMGTNDQMVQCLSFKLFALWGLVTWTYSAIPMDSWGFQHDAGDRNGHLGRIRPGDSETRGPGWTEQLNLSRHGVPYTPRLLGVLWIGKMIEPLDSVVFWSTLDLEKPMWAWVTLIHIELFCTKKIWRSIEDDWRFWASLHLVGMQHSQAAFRSMFWTSVQFLPTFINSICMLYFCKNKCVQ